MLITLSHKDRTSLVWSTFLKVKYNNAIAISDWRSYKFISIINLYQLNCFL